MKKIMTIAVLMISVISCALNPQREKEIKIGEALSVEAVRVELSDDRFSGFLAIKNESYETLYDYIELKAAVSYKDYYGVFMYSFQPICKAEVPFTAQEIRPFFIIPAVNSQSSATIKDDEWDLGYRLLISYKVDDGEWMQLAEYDFPKAEKYYGSYKSTIEIGSLNNF